MFLCINFHSVAEGNPNIDCGVDCHKIYQSAPKGGVKGVHQVGFCKSGKEGFDGCPARLLATDSLIQGFVPRLGSIESCGQSIIAFLVFDLVEGNMSIFVDALLDEVRNHPHLAFQFSLFRFEGGKVEGGSRDAVSAVMMASFCVIS